MKGAIKKVDGEWIVECTLFLHPDNVKHIEEMRNMFDNVESRIFAHHPIVQFQERDGYAHIFGFSTSEESIIFDSEEDKKTFFDALDKNDE
jgi:hypothetical protein